MIRTQLVLLAFTTIAFSACSHSKKETAAVSDEVKAVAQQNDASYVAEVSFDKGSAKLSTAAKNRLDAIVRDARAAGKVDEVKVVTWADAEYPAEPTKRLSKTQRDLAEKRSGAIRDYLKAGGAAMDVDTYNMAERPNAMERLLSTSDARVKRSLENAGIATTAHDLRFPENASKSMVMVILE
jgi:hypothetical protein